MVKCPISRPCSWKNPRGLDILHRWTRERSKVIAARQPVSTPKNDLRLSSHHQPLEPRELLLEIFPSRNAPPTRIELVGSDKPQGMRIGNVGLCLSSTLRRSICSHEEDEPNNGLNMMAKPISIGNKIVATNSHHPRTTLKPKQAQYHTSSLTLKSKSINTLLSMHVHVAIYTRHTYIYHMAIFRISTCPSEPRFTFSGSTSIQ